MPSAQTHRLVGRAAQLRSIDLLVRQLEDGRGAVLFLEGEPGIGKTRLAEEVVARAEAAGARSAWATCWQGDGVPPLWPWAELLRQLTGGDDILERTAAVTPDAAEAARFEQFEAVARALRDATSSDPIVVVLDDLQWADVASVRLLAFLAATLRDGRCLFVATYRTDEIDHDHLATIARLGTTLTMPGLDRAAVAEVLADALGISVEDEVADTVQSRSGGNPLFVWELGRLMSVAGRTDVAAAAVPDAVTAVIERRLARLSEPAVAVLHAAAVAGKVFSAPFVEALADTDADEVVGALESAAAIGLVRRDDEAPHRYEFSHDLVRSVAINGISAARRADLHRRAASAHLANGDASHAVVAEHLARAGPAHRADAALQWEAAAHHALSLLAYEEAADCFARARELSPADAAQHADLILAQADALLCAGDLVLARARFTEAAAFARAASDAERLARAALGIGAGVAGWEVPMADDAQIALLREALAALPHDDSHLRSPLLARLSVAVAGTTEPESSQDLAEQAVALAKRSDDPALLAQALVALCDAIAGPDHTAARRAHAEAIIELARGAGDRAFELLGRRFLVVALLEVGDFPALDREIAEFERLADLVKQPLLSWYAPLFRGMRALLSGRVDEAEHRRAEVAEVGERTGSWNASMLAYTLGLGLDAAQGRATVMAAFETMTDVDPALWPSWASGLGYAALRGGDVAYATRMLRLHSHDGFAGVTRDAEYLTTLAAFGRIAIAIDDRDATGEIYEHLAPYAGLWVIDGIAAHCWGPVEMELARLAIACGRVDDARSHLDAARAAVARAGAALLVADLDRLEAELEGAGTAPRRADIETGNVCRREGQFWTLGYDGLVVRMKDAKGLHDIARLLVDPGREVHVADLMGAPAGGQPDVARSADLGDVLDRRAVAEYRERLIDLEDEVASAEAANDSGRAAKARAERDFLAAELASALGIGGRSRKAGDPNERARKAVSTRIRLTIDRVEASHPSLARHLRHSIRTGTFCSYQPERPTAWSS